MLYSSSYTFPTKNIVGSLLYHLIAIKREQINNLKIRIRVIIYGLSFSAVWSLSVASVTHIL